MSALTTSTTSFAKPTRYLTAPSRLISASLFLGWLFEWAFYAKPIGVSTLLFVIALVGMTVGIGRFESVQPKVHSLWLLVPIFFFATMTFIRANEFLTFLNISAVLFLLMMWAVYFSAESLLAQPIIQYLTRPVLVMAHALGGGFNVVKEASASAHGDERRLANLLPLLRGLLLALPILIVFTALLVSADLIFAQQLEAIFSIDDFESLVLRILLIAWIAWLVMGAMAFALTREQRLISAEQLAKVGDTSAQTTSFALIGNTETTVIMSLVNALFGAFVALQFAYLFGGAKNISLDGFTYSEYARKGFFEMVTVGVLALALIILLKAVTKWNTNKQTIVFNLSSSVMLILVGVMLVSAHQRLTLYEYTYGYTFLRLQSHVFVLWLGIACLWTLASLWRRPERIAIGLFICALAFIVHLNVINPDALIVRHNFDRYQAYRSVLNEDDIQVIIGSDYDRWEVSNSALAFDLYYLETLSNDAVPALLEMLEHLPEAGQQSLTAELESRGDALGERATSAPWQSWHRAETLAYDSLTEHFGPRFLPQSEATAFGVVAIRNDGGLMESPSR